MTIDHSGTLGALARSLRHGSVIQTAKDLRDHLRFEHRAKRGARGIATSWGSPASSAPPDRKVGYDHPEHATMYDDRLGELVVADFPVLYWLSRLQGENLMTASAISAGTSASSLPGVSQAPATIPPSFRWLVCDVPHTVEQGRAVAARSRRAAAPLHHRVAGWGWSLGYLLLASGVLQYLEEPGWGTVAELEATSSTTSSSTTRRCTTGRPLSRSRTPG